MKWSKRPKSLTDKGEFGPHTLPISGQSPKETLGASWHWQLSVNPRQVSAIAVWGCHGTTEQGSSLVWHRVFHSFMQAHLRVSKVQQKACSLGEQRTTAPSILTLSWRIPDEPPRWKVVAKPWKDTRILGLWRRRIQSGARDEAWPLRAFVLLKYKGNRESFWHRH